jgi:hypothetical protein
MDLRGQYDADSARRNHAEERRNDVGPGSVQFGTTNNGGVSIYIHLPPQNDGENHKLTGPVQQSSLLPASTAPPEIQESLRKFKIDHPDEAKAAFIMMRFGSETHDEIAKNIKNALKPLGIVGLRADDKEYHRDLYYNILTYIYGCAFGIAVFDRVLSDQFNPNVAFEVGWLDAIGKPVCLLRDRTLTTFPSDLLGKLYLQFDTSKPKRTIPPAVTKWLKDNRLV